jgi:hypothetical protein
MSKNKSFNPVDFRKSQEAMYQIMQAGVFKELAKYRKALFDAYLETGFTEEQAMQLIIAEVQKPFFGNNNDCQNKNEE